MPIYEGNMRINKFLADCGVASRRASEQYILDGRVKVNGKTVKELSTEIKPDYDHVTVDGRAVTRATELIYIMVHKPKGYLTTASDDRGRKTVMDLIAADFKRDRLFPIGRLDYDTEGLLLMTNDGEVAQKLTHPKGGITKTYVANVDGELAGPQLKTLTAGMTLADGTVYAPCKARLLASGEGWSRVEITISEGKNRQIRRMLESMGYRVSFLKRTAVGSIRLGGLARGKHRRLNQKEMAFIKGL